jgi:hypothetical protein
MFAGKKEAKAMFQRLDKANRKALNQQEFVEGMMKVLDELVCFQEMQIVCFMFILRRKR